MIVMIRTHRPVIDGASISTVPPNKNPAKDVSGSALTKLIHDVLHLGDDDYVDGNVDVDDDHDDSDDNDDNDDHNDLVAIVVNHPLANLNRLNLKRHH